MPHLINIRDFWQKLSDQERLEIANRYQLIRDEDLQYDLRLQQERWFNRIHNSDSIYHKNLSKFYDDITQAIGRAYIRSHDQTALINAMREEIKDLRAKNDALISAVNEAADKFWVAHFYVKDEQTKELCVRKSHEMTAASIHKWRSV